jgi:hypothetical protein
MADFNAMPSKAGAAGRAIPPEVKLLGSICHIYAVAAASAISCFDGNCQSAVLHSASEWHQLKGARQSLRNELA